MNRNKSAFADWWNGISKVNVWLTLAWFDIILRYRRSTLGPLWLTLSMGALIIGMGPLYSSLFGADLKSFFPHLALGIIFWNLFSTVVQESTTVFINAANYLKQGAYSHSLFLNRLLARCCIQLLHHIVIYIPILFFCDIKFSYQFFLFFPAFILFLINAHFISVTLSFVCTRFRDFAQIVTSIMQLLMFLTPVFWLPEKLPERAKYVLWNPLAQMMDLLRAPLMGNVSAYQNWLGICIFTIINIFLACYVYKKYKDRVIYWL